MTAGPASLALPGQSLSFRAEFQFARPSPSPPPPAEAASPLEGFADADLPASLYRLH